MKTTAEAFIWIGMILTCVLIFPLVVGCIALNKLSNAKKASEIKTMGVLTLLFCSQIGGIIMLCLKDEDFEENSKSVQIVKNNTENSVSQDEEILEEIYEFETNNNTDYDNNLRLSTFLQIPVVILSMVFSYIANANYYSALFPALISTFILILYITNITLYLSDKQQYKKINYILEIIIFVLSIALVVGTIIVNFATAYEIWYSTRYNYYLNEYENYREFEYSNGVSWELWLTTILGVTLFILSLIKITNYNTKLAKSNIDKTISNKTKTESIKVLAEPSVKKEQVEKQESKMINHMEVELNEIKRMYDNKVLTKQEYDRIREAIILKYYK